VLIAVTFYLLVMLVYLRYNVLLQFQAAKQHYCINKAVIKKGRIDEECEALMREDYGCKYASSRDSRAGMSAKVSNGEAQKNAIQRLTGRQQPLHLVSA
jgi:hypothetical protein